MKKNEISLFGEASVSKSPRSLILQILIFIAVFIIINIAESVFTMFFAVPAVISELYRSGLSDPSSSYSFSDFYDIVSRATSGYKVMIPMLFCTALAIFICVIYCRFIEKRPISSMGIRKRCIVPHYLQGMLVGFVMMSVITGISVLSGINRISLEKNIGAGLIILYFFGYIIQGASEEIIFRGYFMVSVGAKHSPKTALFVSSLAFAAAHLFNPGINLLSFFNIFLFATFAGLYVIYFDDLWGVCAAHSVWNFAQGNLFGISVSGTGQSASVFRVTAENDNILLSGGKFGIEGSLITTAIELVAISLLLFAFSRRKKRTSLPQSET